MIIVASKNPVKINAALSAFEAMFPEQSWEVEGVSVPSDVSDQPWGESETRTGAKNRVYAAAKLRPEADYWVGIEGGIAEDGDKMPAFAWMAVLHRGYLSEARTASFFLPPPITRLVQEGLELGEADDRVFGVHNSKQQSGAIGMLTGDVIMRETLYRPAMIMALIPFRQPDLYELDM